MEVETLQKAAVIIFELCRNHPELCPHDYYWVKSDITETMRTEKYRCSICGNEKLITKNENDEWINL